MKIFLNVLILIFLLAQNVISADRTISTSNNCDAIKGADAYRVDDNNNLYAVYESNGSKNPFIYIYLKTSGGCRVLLSTQGSVVRFVKDSANKFPDVEASWHIGADESSSTYYIWDGRRYVSYQAGDSERLNRVALEYFKKGDIDRAIEVWEKAKKLSIIPGLGFTSNAEVLNNLGFAYHKLAKKTKAIQHYRLALHYLDAATQVDYKRWEAYLNLADLYVDIDDQAAALKNYQKVLELNPSYKYANKIKDSIAKIKNGNKSTSVILKEIETQIRESLPPVKFKLVQDNICARLEISSNKLSELNQQFECFESAGDIDIIDINFDGYKTLWFYHLFQQMLAIVTGYLIQKAINTL